MPNFLSKFFNRTKIPIPTRTLGSGIPPDYTTQDYLKSYENVGWWHAVVFRIALGLSEVKWTLWNATDRNKPKQIFEHPLLRFLHLINPFQTSEEFIALDTIYMECLGESFWALNFNGMGEPAEAILIYPQNMSVIPAKAFPFVKGYVYGNGVNAVPFDLNEIIHFKYPNPSNQYRGLGQAKAIGINLSAERNADLWVNQFFYNSARPDGVLQFDYNLSDEQFDKLKKQWGEQHQGVSKAHKIALLEGGGKYVQIQNSVKDMDFANLKLKNRDIILGVEGMPQSVMGISENVNRANAEAGDYTFARWIVKPRLEWKRAKLQEQLIPKFRNSQNLQLGFEEIVPETIDQKRELAESGMRAGYLTINEARKLRGLDPLPTGDVLLVPLNLIPTPINAPLEQPEKPVEEPEEETLEEIEQESYKGGEGSGNFGHEGRPGEVGGSGGGGGGGKPSSGKPKPSGGEKPSGGKPKPSSGATGEEWASSLDDDEKMTLRRWQDGGACYQLRNYQATGKGSESIKEYEKTFNSAMDKDGSFEGTVYRGMALESQGDYDRLVNSKTITMKSHSSSSKDLAQAQRFTGKEKTSVIMNIRTKSGVDITAASYTSQLKKQKEVILKKGTKYEVVGRGKIGNITRLDLVEK